MKKYLLTLAKYNRDADKKVAQVFDAMSEEERQRDRKAYFKSFHDTLDHLASSGIFWQNTIRSVHPDFPCFSQNYFNMQFERGKTSFPEYSELKKTVFNLDDNWIEIINKLSDEELETPFIFKTPYGEMNVSPIMVILRHINHCTHHRGQISQILDELKIENDFSKIEKYE